MTPDETPEWWGVLQTHAPSVPSEDDIDAPTPEDPAITWLRQYVAPERWRPVRLDRGEDFQIFGTLYLSHLIAVVRAIDAAREASA